jgi:hypothetical protein
VGDNEYCGWWAIDRQYGENRGYNQDKRRFVDHAGVIVAELCELRGGRIVANEPTGRSDSFDAQAREALQAIAAIHKQAEEELSQVRMSKDSSDEEEQSGAQSDTPSPSHGPPAG